MKAVDLYARVRRACHVEGMSQRQAAREFGIDPKTVAKMLRFSVPPGYRRSKPPVRPKLDGFTGHCQLRGLWPERHGWARMAR